MTEEQVKNRRRRVRRHRRPTRPRELPEIFFCGDPHGRFEQINEAARLYKPDAMVILGDLQPPGPVDEVLEEALALTDIWWIPGNHDTDTDEFYDSLWRGTLGAHNLHGRVANVAGMRIAGLGGVFRGQVWMPEGSPNYYSPSSFMRRVGPANVWRGGVPRRHRSTIFPSVYNNLLRQKADILVTHEAPGCHRKGFAAIDRLAKSLGVTWHFHGHQHEDRAYGQYLSINTRAVGYRGVVSLKGEVVIAAQLDPREELAIRNAPEWDGRPFDTSILVRDADGMISFLPPDTEHVPVILPVTMPQPEENVVPVEEAVVPADADKAPAQEKAFGQPETPQADNTVEREHQPRNQRRRFRRRRPRVRAKAC